VVGRIPTLPPLRLCVAARNPPRSNLAALALLTVLIAGCPPRSPSSGGSQTPPLPPGGSVEPGAFRPIVLEPSGRLYLTFQDTLSTTFRLVRIQFALNDEYVLVCGDGERSLDAAEPILVYDGRFGAGSHTADVELTYRGVGHGVFSYLEGYTFRVRASHELELPAAAFVALHVRSFEHGSPETPIEDRPQISFEDRSADPPRVEPRAGCPWGEEPAP
jgi:hypothetical protein